MAQYGEGSGGKKKKKSTANKNRGLFIKHSTIKKGIKKINDTVNKLTGANKKKGNPQEKAKQKTKEAGKKIVDKVNTKLKSNPKANVGASAEYGLKNPTGKLASSKQGYSQVKQPSAKSSSGYSKTNGYKPSASTKASNSKKKSTTTSKSKPATYKASTSTSNKGKGKVTAQAPKKVTTAPKATPPKKPVATTPMKPKPVTPTTPKPTTPTTPAVPGWSLSQDDWKKQVDEYNKQIKDLTERQQWMQQNMLPSQNMNEYDRAKYMFTPNGGGMHEFIGSNPNVPPVDDRLHAYAQAKDMIGRRSGLTYGDRLEQFRRDKMLGNMKAQMAQAQFGNVNRNNPFNQHMGAIQQQMGGGIQNPFAGAKRGTPKAGMNNAFGRQLGMMKQRMNQTTPQSTIPYQPQPTQPVPQQQPF